MIKFQDLSLRSEIKRAIAELGFEHATEIQGKAIPLLLSGKAVDFHGQAQTGTGKTLAFGIPLVNGIDQSVRETQALIVAPTRELVVQICQSLRSVATHMGVTIAPIYGGASMSEQISQLRRGVQIVVGTPGRLNDHLRRGILNLKSLKTLVLDEADIMLDMGFKEEVDEILTHAPSNRQIWLFSATVKAGISALMRKHMKDTVTVKTSAEQTGSPSIKQYFSIIPMRDRLKALTRFVDAASPAFYGFIFCQTKILTAEVAEQLVQAGYKANAIHGDMSQAQRNRVIKGFKDREFTILVATDVAARGIDVPDVTHVVNYSLPEDQESYVHRSGRTGRAGKEGVSITFTRASDVRYIRALEKKFKVQISPINVPSTQEITKIRIAKISDYVKDVTAPSDVATGDVYAVQQLKDMVKGYSEKEVNTALVALLSEKFLKDLKEQDRTKFAATEGISFEDSYQGDGQGGEGQSEVAIFLGTDDGIDKSDVIEFLEQHTKIDRDEIARVRVINRRSFLKLPQAQAEEVVNQIKGKMCAGHKVRASVSIDRGFDASRRSSGRREGGRDESRGGRRGDTFSRRPSRSGYSDRPERSNRR